MNPHLILAFSLFAACAGLAADAPATATFTGMCDASAAAALDAERFVVADDEDNILRVYSRVGGAALSECDVSEFLGNLGKKQPKEADLEAAATIGAHTFWITSHGRNSKGKEKPERQRFFATAVRASEGRTEIAPVGKPYAALLDDLLADARLAPWELGRAALLAPKAPGGLNIEGLAAAPDGRLLVGFRSPLREGKALVVPLLNPLAVTRGERARLGEPVGLDLGGLGIRSLEWCAGRYVILAGAPGAGGEAPRVFEWDGAGAPRPVPGVGLSGLNPEGVAFHGAEGAGEYFILSDDGARAVDGQDCKSLDDPARKSFRGRTLRF